MAKPPYAFFACCLQVALTGIASTTALETRGRRPFWFSSACSLPALCCHTRRAQTRVRLRYQLSTGLGNCGYSHVTNSLIGAQLHEPPLLEVREDP